MVDLKYSRFIVIGMKTNNRFIISRLMVKIISYSLMIIMITMIIMIMVIIMIITINYMW